MEQVSWACMSHHKFKLCLISVHFDCSFDGLQAAHWEHAYRTLQTSPPRETKESQVQGVWGCEDSSNKGGTSSIQDIFNSIFRWDNSLERTRGPELDCRDQTGPIVALYQPPHLHH